MHAQHVRFFDAADLNLDGHNQHAERDQRQPCRNDQDDAGGKDEKAVVDGVANPAERTIGNEGRPLRGIDADAPVANCPYTVTIIPKTAAAMPAMWSSRLSIAGINDSHPSRIETGAISHATLAAPINSAANRAMPWAFAT